MFLNSKNRLITWLIDLMHASVLSIIISIWKTFKAQHQKITLEFGLTPRSLAWIMVPKIVLSLFFGLMTGTVFFGIDSGLVWILARSGYMGRLAPLRARSHILVSGSLGLWVASKKLHGWGNWGCPRGMIIFFVGGGLSVVRAHKDAITWIAKLFPNIYAVEPLRDLVLFNTWPADFWPVILILILFASIAVLVGSSFAQRKLRRLA